MRYAVIILTITLTFFIVASSVSAKGVSTDIDELKTPTLTGLHQKEPDKYPESGYSLTQFFPDDIDNLPMNAIIKYLKDEINGTLTPVYFTVDTKTEYGEGNVEETWGWVKDSNNRFTFVKNPTNPSSTIKVHYDTTDLSPQINNTGDISSSPVKGTFKDYKKAGTAANSPDQFGGAILNDGPNAVIGDINAQFINNQVSLGYGSPTSSVAGGAIYNSGKISSINGFFLGNSVYSYASPVIIAGGAIYNSGTIDSISGLFLSNYVDSYSAPNYGGAISNSGTIKSINAEFIGNSSVSSSYGKSYGGAIHNSGIIQDISGLFLGNSAYAGNGGSAMGGALSNTGEITAIKADFIGNSSRGYRNIRGGAIYNSGTIGTIIGDFTGNYVAGSSDGSNGGGGIYNDQGTIAKIIGDFTGNYNLVSYTGGGAIINYSGTINEISGDFFNNYAGGYSQYGGAIYNVTNSTIDTITGNFVRNYAASTGIDSYGGAICNNNNSKIGTINANFTGNYTNPKNWSSQGGALFNGNDCIIDAINGDFRENYATGTISSGTYVNSYGGAIFNSNIISKISGNFTGNHASADDVSTSSSDMRAYGGAIYNRNGLIDIIEGDFTDNYVSAYGYAMGGAIYMENGKIESIDGDFINNHAYSQKSTSYGGAVYNSCSYSTYGTINITGDFIDNYAESDESSANGGAVYNYSGYSNSEVGLINITGSFINNYAKGKSTTLGGAIYNAGVINIQNGDFIGNNILSSTSVAYGGAIYNTNTATLTDVSFKNNYAIGSSSSYVNGGAIYSDSGVVNVIADKKNSIFEGNYIKNSPSGPKISNAIYLRSAVLNLNAGDSKIIFNDRITVDSGTININQAGTWDRETNPNKPDGNKLPTTAPTTGTVVFNEDMTYSRNINIYGGTLKLGEKGVLSSSGIQNTYSGSGVDIINKKIETVTIGKVNGDLNIALDTDLSSKKGDIFNISSSVSGHIKINDLGLIGDLAAGTDTFTRTFLTGAGANAITTELLASLSKIYGQTYTYAVTLNGKDLTFDRREPIGGLQGAVAANDPARTYIMDIDEIVTDWKASTKNDLQGGNLVIKGNGNSIIGENNQGITVNNGQTLEANAVGSTENNTSWQNFTSENGGALKNTEGTVIIKDSTFTNNTAANNGGAIYNKDGNVNIKAENTNVVFENNTANGTSNALHSDGGNINLNAQGSNQIIFNDSISSDTSATLNINSSTAENASSAFDTSNQGEIVINADMTDFKGDINLYHGTLKVGENGTFFNNVKDFNVLGCTLDLANGITQATTLGNLTITDQLQMQIDADLANTTIDTITAINTITDADKINVTKINLLSDAAADKTTINFADATLKDTVTYSGSDVAYSPIYKYRVAYDKTSGNFDFTRYIPQSSESYNPAILTTPVAAQLGGYLTQLNTYEQAFNNIDMYMIMPKSQRNAFKYKNQIASNDSNLSFSPLMTPYEQKGAWFKPYSTFENVPLKNGPTVSNVAYGSLFGVDSPIRPLKNGFDGMMSVYTGYTGSHQAFQGNSIYQNGGVLGLTGAVYKGNFYSALTANAGATAGDATTMYGSDTFTMLMAGIASKTGYNWELANNKFIIQPNMQMSYTFVNTFDYTNKAGINISSSPLNALQIAPGVKLIGNLKNGWQPYLNVVMVWNIMDETKFKANNVQLPNMSVDPYIMYGLGVQKTVGERFSGFAQAMLRNGGRNGIGFQLGFRWTIGQK